MDVNTKKQPQIDQPSLKLWRAGCRFTQNELIENGDRDGSDDRTAKQQ
jgi:hypothetical protein